MASYYSKRERLAYSWDWLRWKLGLFQRFEDIDFSKVRRVVFVCKGNICRSAYAEARFRQAGLEAASFGIHAVEGRPANPDAVRVALRREVDLSGHRTTSLDGFVLQAGDLLACMERAHIDMLYENQVFKKVPIYLIGIAVSVPRISDPYGKSDKYFESTFNLMDSIVLEMASYLGKRLTNTGSFRTLTVESVSKGNF